MTPFRQRALVTILIGLGLLIVGFFGLRTVSAVREFRVHGPPAAFQTGLPETDVELIRDWMTISFISHTYSIPPRSLYDVLGIPPKGNEEKSLKQLNDEYFPDQPGYVLSMVKSTLQKDLPHKAESVPTAFSPPTKVATVSP